ncbi:hypothetical protein AX15_000359 [Amanita polypyramis BW_CC]|nr:hypothetical protein AX15_000359 [Amanita polypyramis BW_CC]
MSSSMSSQPSDPALDAVLSTSASTLRAFTFPEPATPSDSSLDNSPLDSPFSDSISSLPSVSSSFFFSSAAASPPHSQSSQLDNNVTQGLIIPSLTLSTALHRPTPYGQTLGDLRVLILARKGADTSLVPVLLSDDNEDIVDVGTWEQTERARIIKASTDWVEHSDAHGWERFEPLRNVEFTEFPAYDSGSDVDELIHCVRHCVQEPFQCLSDVLHPKRRASSVLSNLLSSPYSPLYTAIILLLPPSQVPDNLDFRIVDDLGAHIPIITFPTLSRNTQDRSYGTQVPVLSSFQPYSLTALRAGLFRSPEIVALLRSEAADRFMRWREIECAVADICSIRNGTYSPEADTSGSVTTNDNLAHLSPSLSWDKAKWESEWMPSFSVDVAKRIRQGTITQRPEVPVAKESPVGEIIEAPEPSCTLDATLVTPPTPLPLNSQGSLQNEKRSSYTPKTCSFAETFPSPSFGRSAMYDPLHFPSLLIFSVSLLGPLKERFDGSLSFFWDAFEQVQVKVALISGFVIGIGVGLAIR